MLAHTDLQHVISYAGSPGSSHTGYIQRKGLSWYWIVISLPSTNIYSGQASSKISAEAMARQHVLRKSYCR